MCTFIENYLHFMKNCIRPPYEKLKPLKSGFIENSIFENNRDPCLRVWHLVIFRADQLKKPPCILVPLRRSLPNVCLLLPLEIIQHSWTITNNITDDWLEFNSMMGFVDMKGRIIWTWIGDINGNRVTGEVKKGWVHSHIFTIRVPNVKP